MSQPSPRTVEVLPPSRSAEGKTIALIGSAIILVALYTILLRAPLPGSRQQEATLPFQLTFQDLPSPEQRMFRALSEGFGEAKRRRAAEGKWPAPERLAADEVPPFAPDALDKSGYRWSRRQDGLLINYLGTPQAKESPELLLLIQEPEPVGAETAGLPDEEHQQLPDGKLLHVTYWKKLRGEPNALVVRPEVEGWTQVRFREPAK